MPSTAPLPGSSIPVVAKIVAVFGPCRGVVRDIEAGLLVGRSAEAGLQLIDEKVSREHCRIGPREGAFAIEDLGSRNGTYVNGAKLDGAHPLKAGDEIGVGESVLVYEPVFEALRARHGEATVLLDAQAPQSVAHGERVTSSALERAGELALRAAMSADPDTAAQLLADAVQQALQASSVAVLIGSGAHLTPWVARPAGQALSVSRPLVELALGRGQAVAGEQPQSLAETDAHTTRVRRKPSHVVCAPFFRAGQPGGAVCAARERAFTADDIALAGALASAVGPALARAASPAARESVAPQPVAESPAMREALRLATAAARADATVLITGETGVGKEELARTVHSASRRCDGPFVSINCGAIAVELAESELFGHEKGAFTGAVMARAGVFEQADGGTLFLDEVGELPAAMQVKLLRVLQDRLVTRVGGSRAVAVDTRIVAATHRDLPEAVKKGEFREDLFWRLNVVRIHVPPLRERPEDVMPLAERFLARLAPTVGARAEGFTPQARQALQACLWPGNARQLANAVERALVLRSVQGPVAVADLPVEVTSPTVGSALSAGGPRTLGELVKALEREQIVLALQRAKGVKVAAAESLGISRPTLDRKIEEYDLRVTE
jgi:DNA-binding NtrC family response regulator/pSer/pThr/pTyr-binding forkhead associated (FHA) protein